MVKVFLEHGNARGRCQVGPTAIIPVLDIPVSRQEHSLLLPKCSFRPCIRRRSTESKPHLVVSSYRWVENLGERKSVSSFAIERTNIKASQSSDQR